MNHYLPRQESEWVKTQGEDYLLKLELKAIKAGYGSLPKLRRVRDELAEENEAQRLRIAELEAKSEADREYMDAAEKRIAELEAEVADESARVEEFRSTLAETRKQRDAILARAEQAESHAADCKRLVTACENDLDAERMKRRELETETARYEHLYEAERRVRIAMDKRAEQAEAEVAELKVCIVCDHCSGVDDSRWCDEEKPWDESVWLYDLCHYSPSRWTARAEEGSEK